MRTLAIAGWLLILACGRSQFTATVESSDENDATAGNNMSGDTRVLAQPLPTTIEVGLQGIANPIREGQRTMTLGDPHRSTSVALTALAKPRKPLNNLSSKGKLDLLMVIDNSQDNGARSINYTNIAGVISNLLAALSAVDWRLTLASSTHPRYLSQQTKVRASSSIAAIHNVIENLRDGVQDAWRVYDERVVWKTRSVLGDGAVAAAAAWKGGVNTEEQRSANFFPFSAWDSTDAKWVKTSDYAASHSWLREEAKLAVIMISDEDHQCTRDPNSEGDGGGPDTREVLRQKTEDPTSVPDDYRWNSFTCGIGRQLVAELDYHKGAYDRDRDEYKWRLFGIFDTHTRCKDLGDDYDPESVWIKNTNKKHINPCFKGRSDKPNFIMSPDSLAFAFSYKTRYGQHFSNIFDLNTDDNYASFSDDVKEGISEHLVEARYDLGFSCAIDDLEVKIGEEIIPHIVYDDDENRDVTMYNLAGNILTFPNDRIFFEKEANSGLATCTTEVIEPSYDLHLQGYKGTPRCGEDNMCSTPVACTYAQNNDELTLMTRTGLSVGDAVHVCYDAEDGMENRLGLPSARVADSVKLAVDGQLVCNEQELTLDGDSIELDSACAAQHVSRRDTITATYKEIISQQQFTVSAPIRSSTTYNKEEWKVFVNDVQIKDTDYQRQGRTLTLTGKVPPDSKVKVELHLIP